MKIINTTVLIKSHGPNGRARASIPVNTKEEIAAPKKKYGAHTVEFQKSHIRTKQMA